MQKQLTGIERRNDKNNLDQHVMYTLEQECWINDLSQSPVVITLQQTACWIIKKTYQMNLSGIQWDQINALWEKWHQSIKNELK